MLTFVSEIVRLHPNRFSTERAMGQSVSVHQIEAIKTAQVRDALRLPLGVCERPNGWILKARKTDVIQIRIKSVNKCGITDKHLNMKDLLRTQPLHERSAIRTITEYSVCYLDLSNNC